MDRSRAVSKVSILLAGIDIFRSGLGIFGIEYLASISAHPSVVIFSSSCPHKGFLPLEDESVVCFTRLSAAKWSSNKLRIRSKRLCS